MDPNGDPNDDPNKNVFQSIHLPLKSVIRHEYHLPTIDYFTRTYHQITVHALQFLKLYYLDRFENGIIINITQKLMENICKTVSKQDPRGKKPADDTDIMRAQLRNFYNMRYFITTHNQPKPSSTYLHTAIQYFSKEVVTMYENKVKQRFYSCIEKYIAYRMGTSLAIEDIESDDNLTAQQKAAAKARVYRVTQRTVEDVFVTQRLIVNGELIYNYTSPQLMPAHERAGHRQFLDHIKATVLPNGPFENGNIKYDLKAHPLRYFSKMVAMSRVLEAQVGIGEIDNVFPLRTSNIPGHFRIDTTTLINMLYPRSCDEDNEDYEYIMNRTDGKKKGYVTAARYLSDNKDLLWDLFFKCQEKRRLFHGSDVLDGGHDLDIATNVFGNYLTKHSHTFHHQILTDGESCTILLVHKSKAHILHPHNDPNAPIIEERYIHNIDDNTREELVGMNIVGIDPGKSDLLRAVNCPEKLVWRYTQNQRRFDTDSNFYKNQLKIERRQHLVDGQSIEQLESQFGQVTSKKHLSFALFRVYCYDHNHLVLKVQQFYNQHKHRKRRFQRYRKRQRSEARMINSFKEKFGDPEVTIVCIGDWSERNHGRFLEPVKGKGFRKLFKKAGYQLFLVDEFRTSKMCSKCENEEAECVRFRWVKNPKPRSRIAHPISRCHGLLRCTTCNTLWDRDILGATNIYKIADMAINGEERPQYLRRQQQQ
jgi:hypothetical protein